MSILSLLTEFIRDIRQQKLRTTLTVFGIMWGTATIIVLLAFSMGFRDQIIYSMRGMGDEIVILWPGTTSKAYEGYGIGRRIQFRESDAWLLQKQIPEILEIGPEYSRWGQEIRYGERVNSLNVGGVYPNYGGMRNIFPQEGGRWLNDIDIEQRRRVIFLGDKVHEVLFNGEDAIGKYVYINGVPFMVIGIMEPKLQNSSYSARDQDRTFIPATTFSALYGTERINNIIYTPVDPTVYEEVHGQIRQVLSRKYRFDVSDRDAISIWDTNEFWKFSFYFFLGMNLFMGMIGAFTLAVGGIGVANIMFVVVQERMPEIGIRRSVGAKRWNIMTQFFAETFFVVALGGVLGYLIGWVVIQAMQYIPISEYVGTPQFTPSVGIGAFAVLAFVGLAAGLLPARRASRLDVVECLRK
jgi:putative ABC transport system permease protein